MRWIRGPVSGLAFILGLVALLGGLLVGSTTVVADIASGHPLDAGTIVTLVSAAVAIAAGFALFWVSRAVGGEYGIIRDYRERPRKRRGAARV
jgi:hypothetical protein